MITNVYGKCDGVFINFKQASNGRWECVVPTDFTDGTYVIELYAEDIAGNIAFYTGTLYMCDCQFIGFEINNCDYDCIFSNNHINIEFMAVVTC